MASPISNVDVVGIPTQDPQRSRAFSIEALGQRYASYADGAPS